MRAARYDFTIARGEDWAKDFEFTNGPFDANAGWTAELVLGTTITLKAGAGLVLSGKAIHAAMDKVKTAIPANYHRDDFRLVLINPAGEDATYIKGKATWATQ